ncbi:ATP synthase mitochondrial F1 complex assembly factor 1 isoform X2 [Syngnathoides biaculeatus]|uniref:ATP synthase mitochondrial F1 complex assembly factor 1 isoform X2 n=1 Tax=Syngnathoides biaculeatus TaxID=300417 RepID=UPI002ADE8011|nr:ATP synthase mitochondrial F1 complex assembly factor 1 isoform X2 [Syngnathoides biaculeatus]
MSDRSNRKMTAALVQMSCMYRGMLAVRATGIRPIIPGLIPTQFRAFSVRKDPELENNPYFHKYEEKIQKMRSSKPQEFKARLEKCHNSKKEVHGNSKEAEFMNVMEKQLKKRDKLSTGNGKARGFVKNMSLGSILNLELIQDKTGEEIAELWMKYYATKDTISAVIPSHTFEVIVARAQLCSMFLFALPQNEGYEFFVGQWSGHELHFTSLVNIQTHGESAPSQMILYHYPDLKENKGIVLMTAELDPRFITVSQAQCLANQVQLFYELEQSGIGTVLMPTSSQKEKH